MQLQLRAAMMRARPDGNVIRKILPQKPQKWRDFQPTPLNSTPKVTHDINIREQLVFEVQIGSYQQPQKAINIAGIQEVVAAHFGVTALDILSHRRTAAVTRPRMIACYLCRVITLKSLPEIGRRFGKRDHSTIWHAVSKIEQLIKSDPTLAAEISELRSRLS